MSEKKTVRYLYHSTILKNLESILKNGLEPKKPLGLCGIQTEGIFLSIEPFSWMEWATSNKMVTVCGERKDTIYRGASLKIDVNGLKVEQDNRISVTDFDGDVDRDWRDWVCLEHISPDRIVEVSVETESNHFEEFDLEKWRRENVH